MADLTQLYQQDYSEWARRNRELLRAGRFAELDLASKETGLALDLFPPVCPYRTEQIVDEDDYPGR